MTTVRRIALWLFIAAVCTSRTHAQGPQSGRVTGFVTDSVATPLPGVNVSAPGFDGAERRAVTDSRGRFDLSGVAIGDIVVVFRFPGYVAARRELRLVTSTTQDLSVMLVPTTAVLSSVVITGNRTPTLVRSISNAITVLEASDISTRGVQQVQDLFRGDVPGMFSAEIGAGRTPGASAEIYSRGSNSLGSAGSPPKFYVDGVLYSDAHHVGMIDPASIERIEVIPGPAASTIYGSNAINGVVQIFLKKGSPLALGPRVAVDVGMGTIQNSFDKRVVSQADHRVAVEGAVDAHTTYFANASYRDIGPYVPSQRNIRRATSAGVRVQGDRLTTTVSLRYGNQSVSGLGSPLIAGGILNGTLAPTTRAFDVLTLGQRSNGTQQGIGLTLDYTATSWWTNRLTVGRDESVFNADVPPSFATNGDTLFQSSRSTNTTTTVSYVSTLTPRPIGSLSSSLTIGADYTDEESAFAGGSTPELLGSYVPSNFGASTNPTRGYFAETLIGFRDIAFFTAAIRAEDNPVYAQSVGINYTPRFGLSLVHELAGVSAKLRASVGRSTRAPSNIYKQDFIVPLPGLGILIPAIVGNPTIRAEQQRGYEVGVDLARGRAFSLQVTRFDQQTNDLILSTFADTVFIATDPTQDPLAFVPNTYVNLGVVRTRGWESSAHASVRGLEITGTLSSADSRVVRVTDDVADYRPGDRVPGPAARTGALFGRYRWWRLNAGARLNYTGPIELIVDNLTQTLQSRARLPYNAARVFNPGWTTQSYGSFETNGYRTLDINFGMHVLEHVDFTAWLYNATNVYRTDNINTNITPGRRFLGSLRLTF